RSISGFPAAAPSGSSIELAGIQPEDNSLGVQLLARIQSMFERKQTDRLSSETIVHVLADSEDRPWPDRLPLTKAQLARLLAPFGIRATIVPGSRTHVSRGYLAADFADAFARYLPHQPILLKRVASTPWQIQVSFAVAAQEICLIIVEIAAHTGGDSSRHYS